MTTNQLFFAVAGLMVTLFGLCMAFVKYYMDAKFEGVNNRFDDMRDLWRAELYRVEGVLDARLKHMEEKLPPSTLDEHVTIGGPYFDVLEGECQLEPRPNGMVVLHLFSKQRLSTDFNGYAGLWTDAVMQSLQRSILEVVKNRCEHAGS